MATRTAAAGRNVKRIEQIAYHRNGMTGAGFYVVNFTHHVDGEPGDRHMVGIVFGSDAHTAVFDRDALGLGEIEFGGTDDGRNSWRGDMFDRELRAAINTHEGEEVV